MTTLWILIYIVHSVDGYQGNSPIATGSVTFHSQASCENAAKQFKTAFCLEDTPETNVKLTGTAQSK